jgi:hypothetical protein
MLIENVKPILAEYAIQPSKQGVEEVVVEKISLDLVRATQNELGFLMSVDAKREFLQDPALLSAAVQRYETCWLPMQVAEPDLTVVPPMDVYWVWHCHMLNPTQYRRDLMALFGAVVDHFYWSDRRSEPKVRRSAEKWRRFNPHEAYDIKESAIFASCRQGSAPKYQQQSDYDILGATVRQMRFIDRMLSILTRSNDDAKVVDDAVDRYTKYLFLRHKYPNELLSPADDFDLAWHAHQVHTAQYSGDSEEIFGFLLPHNDNIQRNEMPGRYKRAEELWRAEFGSDYWI